jgi:putative membrane protein
MERPQNIVPNIKAKRVTFAIRLIVIFHLVGLAGLLITATRPLFLQLVPYHLLLMLLILFCTHEQFNRKFVYFFLFIFIIGFAVEWIGVHTGKLFGNYNYGPTLGLQLDGIPVIMGVNWFLLIYAVGVSLQYLPIKAIWLRILIGAIILVLLDLLIEPVAIHLNYWHWVGKTIPFTNYICWFMVSAIFLLIFEWFKFKKQSIVAVILLVSQFIFFAALQ